MVFYDIEAAFPSLLHQALFFILSAMGLPSQIMRLVRALYLEVWVIIQYRGCCGVGYYCRRGVKQGRPASGSFWALISTRFYVC